MTLSRTKQIKENRGARLVLDSLIDSMKNGLLDNAFDVLFKTDYEYEKGCRLKKCDGILNYDQYQKHWYCNKCFLIQKLKFIGEKKTLLNLGQIQEKEDSLRNYRAEELEEIAQLLRNIYRIAVDDMKCPEPTEEQTKEAKKLFKKIQNQLYYLRNKFNDRHDTEILYSLIKNGKAMNFDEIDSHLANSQYNTMNLIDAIGQQFSKQMCLKLVVLNIPDEPRKRIADLEKAERIIARN